MSDTQLYFSDLNKDYEVNEEDIQILENIINNPEQINNKKVCDRGYVLNGDNCELKETVAAEIDDGSVGRYSSQGTNKVSFGFADFYKTKVGNTNVYWQAVDAVAGNKDILIEKLNNLKSENEAYLVASNIILYSYDTYDQLFNEGAEMRSAGNASYENYINLMNSPIGDLSNALGSIIRHENGHIIDFMNQKITGQYLHDLSYDGYTVSQYMECYKNMKPLNNPLSGKKLSSCFCPDCLRDYSYRKVVEFWADLFASIEYEYEWTVLKENTLNDELRELRDYLAQTYISNYNKNKTKVREIQKEYSNIYYVNYDANGGTGKMNPQIFFTGKTGWLQKNEFKNGEKTFKGWRAKRSNGEWYCYSDYSKSTLMWNSKGYCDNFGYYLFKDSDYIYNLAKTDDYVTMYAQWDYPMSLTIEYSYNNKSYTQNITSSVPIKLEPNTFSKEGYVFDGWHAKNKQGLYHCYTDWYINKSWTVEDVCKKYDYVTYQDKQEVSFSDSVIMIPSWKKSIFTIKFNGNGATSGSMSNQKVTYGTAEKIRANKFKRDKYKFIGWRVYNQNRNKWACEYFNNGNKVKGYASVYDCKSYINYRDKQTISKTANPGETIIMYAQWELKPFTIKFNGNSATSGSMSNQEVTYGKETKIKANNFKKDKYKFIGWYVFNETRNKWACKYYSNGSLIQGYAKEQDCVKRVKYSDKQTISKTAEAGETIRMDAQWKKNTFKIIFNGNSATRGSMTNQEVTYGENTQIKANSFKKDKYKFIGWRVYNQTNNKWACKYYSNGKLTQGYAAAYDCNSYVNYRDKQTISKTANPGETIIMYAQWELKPFTIKFNGNSSTSGSMSNQEVTYGKETKIKANAFRRSGYVFDGWYVFNQTRNKWACKYYSDGKLTQGYAVSQDCVKRVKYRDKQTISKTAEAGETIIMYAQWKKNTFKIIFNGNSATRGSMTNQEVTYGKDTQIKANSFKKDKYKFTGWRVYNQTNNKWVCKYYSNGKLTQGYAAAYDCNSYVNYRDKQTISKTANPGETIIMYAQWEKLTCSVGYKCSQGNISGGGITSMCRIKIGDAKKEESYKCPQSYMHKDSNSKCSYNAHYVTSSYYTCPYGGTLSGYKCYVGTKKTTSYHCSSGVREGKGCYRYTSAKSYYVCS